MSTSHKPTYHPAIASENQGGFRYGAPRQQFSVRDMHSHTKLKTRQLGQSAPDEVAYRDLKSELEDREAEHFNKIQLDKKRQGLIAFTPSVTIPVDKDKPVDSKLNPTDGIDWSQFDDSDDSEENEDESTDEDEAESSDEDDEAMLLRELEKIKKEAEAKKLKEAQEEAARAAEKQSDESARSNPLINLEGGDKVSLKRRWDDDLVFRNQSRNVAPVKKRFINDTTRNDFHKRFLYRYVK